MSAIVFLSVVDMPRGTVVVTERGDRPVAYKVLGDDGHVTLYTREHRHIWSGSTQEGLATRGRVAIRPHW